MNCAEPEKPQSDFHSLTPSVVIATVEEALGQDCENNCRPMNSYINRVYDLKLSSGEGVVAKFYRPRRWSRETLLNEQEFLCELREADIPVIAPLRLANGETLGVHDDMMFSVFPKKGGRNCDEFTLEQWTELGRLMGRVHLVGEQHEASDRVTMLPDELTENQVSMLLDGEFMDDDVADAYEDAADRLLDLARPLFEGKRLIRIHGDCHFANIIYRPEESFYLIDFDDMAMGPAVQDLWMLLPGREKDVRGELNAFLSGYELFRPFDRRELQLIEPLRAMRYIHYCAWCARQVADGGFSRIAPDWGTRNYWQGEIRDINNQCLLIEENSDLGFNRL